MAKDKRTRRSPSIGVERLDERISLSGFAYYTPAYAAAYAYPTPSPVYPTPTGPVSMIPPGSRLAW